jgi:hypothetical protein
MPVWRPIGFQTWALAMVRLELRHHYSHLQRHSQSLTGLRRTEMSVKMVESGRIEWWMSINQRGARARQRSDIIRGRGIAEKRSYPPDYSAVHSDNSNKPSSSDSNEIQRDPVRKPTNLQATCDSTFLSNVFLPAYVSFPTAKTPVFPPKEVGAACESEGRWRHHDKSVPGS